MEKKLKKLYILYPQKHENFSSKLILLLFLWLKGIIFNSVNFQDFLWCGEQKLHSALIGFLTSF